MRLRVLCALCGNEFLVLDDARRYRVFREMRRQRFADFLDRFHERVAEFLVLKVLAHLIDKTLPKSFAAFFVNRLVSDHGELVGARRDENEDGVLVLCFVHSEVMKFFLRRNQRITAEFAALNINTDLAGSL